jgi:hypothetical protein
MTAARRGQKVLLPPPNCDVHRREASPVGLSGQPSATPQPSPSAPRACHLMCASTPSRRVAEQGVTMQFVDK